MSGIKELSNDVTQTPNNMVNEVVPTFMRDGGKSGISPEKFADQINTHEIQEYKIDECSSVAEKYFTPEVLTNWNKMSIDQRSNVYEQYAHDICKSLNVTDNGIQYVKSDKYWGANSGTGVIYLNTSLLSDPNNVLKAIDTIAHEERHQFQSEAIKNTDQYSMVDTGTLKEWRIAENIYPTQETSKYDPWGYRYNPLEMDSRHFGESIVSNLTRDYII
jgi:hypothetical protein